MFFYGILTQQIRCKVQRFKISDFMLKVINYSDITARFRKLRINCPNR